MGELDNIFDPGWSASASELFTNRVSELAAFDASVLGHLERVVAGEATLSNPARRNALVFYGTGGVGKTALSRRLERWISGELTTCAEWGQPPALDHDLQTLQYDFHGSATFDPVPVLLGLRTALAASERRFPAFDLGLTVWWTFARSGQPLPQLRSRSGFDVRGQITDTVNEALSEAGARLGLGPFTVRTGALLVDAIRSRRGHQRALRECAPLRELVAASQKNATDYVAASLAGLLSWDLEHGSADPILLITFADSVEYLQRSSRSGERLFNRLVHLTPSVLWVVTSRASLPWAKEDLRNALPAVGGAIWPGLRLGTTDEPHQHLVGNLIDEDVVDYLRAASGTGGNPSLSDQVIERIRAGAHGLPLYLDLALDRARAAAGRGTVDPSTFGGPLPELVGQVFAELPDEEQHIARAASLVPRFAPELVAVAVDQRVGAARRLCSRTLVTEDDHHLFPFRLHDTIAAAVRDESELASGAWSTEDRAHTAQRLLEGLHDLDERMKADVTARLDVLELSMFLASRVGGEVPWMLESLLDMPGLAQVAERLPPPDDATWIGHVSRFFGGWRAGRGARARIEYFRDLLEGPLPPDVEELTRRFLAYALRTTNQYLAALPILEGLLAEHPESQLYRYQVARTLRALGRFDLLDEHLRRNPIEGDRADRLASDLAMDLGDLEGAVSGAETRARRLRSDGQHRIAIENEAVVLWRRTLAARTTERDCDDFIDEADRFGMWLLVRTGLASKLLASPNSKSAQIVEAQDTVIRARNGKLGFREFISRAVSYMRSDDHRSLADLHQAFRESNLAWTPNYSLADRIFRHAGFDSVFSGGERRAGPTAVDLDARWAGHITRLVSWRR